MQIYSLTHVSDTALLRDLAELVVRDRVTTATLLAHIAEVDARRLYVPAGYSSMHAYCVDELGLSEDAASKRIQAARAARQFPVLFIALAEGRLHLSAVCLLAPHLTAQNASELIEASSHRRKSDVEDLLSLRFSLRLEAPASVRPITALSQHAPGHVGGDLLGACDDQLLPGDVGTEHSETRSEHAPGHVEGAETLSAEASPERYLVQVTIGKNTREKLRYAQALLSHAVPTGDMAQVLDRALDALISKLERRKFATTTRPRCTIARPPERPPARKRHVPAHVRRAVWERDQGQCTFVGSRGKRCTARRFLEFDHVDPVARGGRATVEGMRLRCRAHNQYEAERVFGVGFMGRKRHEARAAAAARAAAQEQALDVQAGLRNLGYRPHEARRAAEYSQAHPHASLEERMRAALGFLSKGATPNRTSAAVFHGG